MLQKLTLNLILSIFCFKFTFRSTVGNERNYASFSATISSHLIQLFKYFPLFQPILTASVHTLGLFFLAQIQKLITLFLLHLVFQIPICACQSENKIMQIDSIFIYSDNFTHIQVVILLTKKYKF